MGVLAILNLVLSLVSKLVDWGARSKVFKEDEAMIAAKILERALYDINLAKEVEERLNHQFDVDPDSVLRPDEFTRPPEKSTTRPPGE